MCQSYSLKQYCDKDIKYHPCINNLKPNVNEYFTDKIAFKSRYMSLHFGYMYNNHIHHFSFPIGEIKNKIPVNKKFESQLGPRYFKLEAPLYSYIYTF